MKTVRRMMQRLRGALFGQARERELTDEIELHIEMQTEDNLRAGMPPEMARRAAVLKFGGIESVKESYREQRGLPLLETFWSDLRYGVRQLRRTPGFTLTAMVALALGIGATTATFTIVNAVLLKPLPVPEPDRFVVLRTRQISAPGESADNPSASPAKFMHWRAQSTVLQDVSALFWGAVNYTDGGTVEEWRSIQVSADAFHALGMRLLQGRSFTTEEDLPGGPAVAVISEGLWKRRFASDPRILDRQIILGGEPHTVVGVVEESPALLELGETPSDVYLPFRIDPNTSDQGNIFYVVARLKPGVTLEQAGERLQASTAEYRAKYPDALGAGATFTVAPVQQAIIEDVQALLLVLAGAVGLVLLIACSNVAGLLLMRAVARRREIGIRLAVGAARGRVIRQLLTESVLLSTVGGGLGLLLGHAGIQALLASSETDLTIFGAVEIDWRVMAFTLAVSLASGIGFGLFPALQASQVDLNAVLKDGGRWGTGRHQSRIRAALVVSQVSLAVVLLVGSALLIRTFVALYTADRGFETANVITLRTSLTGPRYQKTAAVADVVRRSLESIRSQPGVIAAAATCCIPLSDNLNTAFNVVGRPAGAGPYLGSAGWNTISPGYFDVFRIPVKRGRTLSDRDDGKAPLVVLINESMAREFWKDRDPLQDRIVMGKGLGQDWDDPPRQIIGIVGDVRQAGLGADPGPRIYIPQAQLPDALNAWMVRMVPMSWIVRTQTEPHPFMPAIQEQLRQVALPAFEVQTMDEVAWISIGQERFNMALMTVFGGSALLLAAIGIYGLIAYTVERRTHEIGIRLALGAHAAQVRNMVVRQGMSLAAVGLAVGLGGAWRLARMMESLLFGVKAHDAIVFLGVPLVLGAVALLAVWVPAIRASRVRVVDSLRSE